MHHGTPFWMSGFANAASHLQASTVPQKERKPQTRFKWSPDDSCLTAVTKLFIVRLWVFINTQRNSGVLWGKKLRVPLTSAAVLKGRVARDDAL